jgi:hypothetical protein
LFDCLFDFVGLFYLRVVGKQELVQFLFGLLFFDISKFEFFSIVAELLNEFSLTLQLALQLLDRNSVILNLITQLLVPFQQTLLLLKKLLAITF